MNIRRLVAALSSIAILSTFVVSTATAASFSDVEDGKWYSDAVQTVVEADAYDASEDKYEPGKLMTRAEAVRYVVLVAGHTVPEATEAPFPDVGLDHPDVDYIAYAADAGIVSGYGEGSKAGMFGPEDTLSREEYATMSVLGFDLEMVTPEEGNFTDVPADRWSYEYVETCAEYEIIAGYGDDQAGTFGPSDDVKRDAAAVIVHEASVYVAGGAEGEGEGEGEPVGEGTLSVDVETPDGFSSVVPQTADYVPVMELVFSANGADIEVDKLIVTRAGLSQNSDIDVLSLFIGEVQYGTNVSLNSNNTATFNLSSDAILVEDGDDVTVTVAVSPSSTSETGDILGFSIDEEGDIGSDAEDLDGDFPLESDEISISTTTIGTYTIEAGPDSPSADYAPEAGDENVRILQWKLTASAEPLEVRSFTLFENGTAASSDYAALKVYNDTDSEMLCEADTWDASGKYTCVLDEELVIGKGDSMTFSLKVDVNSGSGTTMSAKLRDSGAYGVRLIGQDYGYIVGTGSTWAGTATAQTIAAGALVVTLSNDTPATGNVAAGGDDVVLVRFAAEAKGEPVTVTEWSNTVTLGGTATYDQVTNCTLTNETTDDLVAGPVDLTTATDNYVRFTDTFEMPLGVNTMALACDLANDMVTLDTLVAGFDQSNNGENGSGNDPEIAITAKGANTNDSITASPSSDVLGRTQPVKAGDVAAIAMTTPPADSMIPGTTNVHFANLQIDTTGSGEDVKVTTMAVSIALGGAAAVDDLQNLGLYTNYVAEEDCTGTSQLWNSTLGLCRLDDLQQPVSGTTDYTYSLETPLVAKKGEASIVAVYADYKSGVWTATSETFTVDWKADTCISGTGSSTGTTVSDTTCTTGSGQAMASAEKGTLTSSWGNNPTANENVVAGTANVPYGDYKVIASDEDIILKTLMFTRADGDVAGSAANFGQVHLYRLDGSTETFLQSAYLDTDANTVTFDLEAAGVSKADRTVEEDETVKLRVYADLNSTSGGGATSGTSDKFTLVVTGTPATEGLVAVGAGSGSAIYASDSITTSKYKVIRKSIPTIASDTGNLSTSLGNGTRRLTQFTITADPAGDVTFKKMSFDVVLNDNTGGDLTLTGVKLYNLANTSTAITVKDPDGTTGTATSCADGAGVVFAAATELVICAPETEEVITANTSATYYLEGTVGSSAASDSIDTTLSAETTTFAAASNLEYVGINATAVVELDSLAAKTGGSETSAVWIWSDGSAGAKHTDLMTAVTETVVGEAADWTGGYLLKVLPSNTFSISKS